MREKVGTVEDFPDRRVTIHEVDGTSIGIFRDGDELSAMLNICPHRAAPVCEGLLGGTMLPSEPGEFRYGMDGLVLRCPWHGWEFDVRNGESIGPVDKRNLTMVAIAVEDGDVYVDIRERVTA